MNTEDLNDCHEAEKQAGLHDRDNRALRVKWINNLRKIVSRRCPVNKAGSSLVTDVDIMTASAAERAEALYLTLK